MQELSSFGGEGSDIWTFTVEDVMELRRLSHNDDDRAPGKDVYAFSSTCESRVRPLHLSELLEQFYWPRKVLKDDAETEDQVGATSSHGRKILDNELLRMGTRVSKYCNAMKLLVNTV